jgi:glycogen phosphorylase
LNLLSEISKSELTEKIVNNVKSMFRKTIDNATHEQIYQALAFSVRDIVTDRWIATQDTYQNEDSKVVYYLSMEFLMGRFLGNTIINLTMHDNVTEVLNDLKFNYKLLIEEEKDPGLGNGGLGRLAACFLDSLATLEYPSSGCGIRYHYGLFEQKIENGEQVEYPDNWLENGDIWGVKRPEYSVEINFGGTVSGVADNHSGEISYVTTGHQTVVAVPYDYPILGYNNNTVNTLRLWDAEAKNQFDLQSFNKGDYSKSVEEQNLAKVLTHVLYPAEEHMAGKELRLKQQYFFISATLQRVVSRFTEKHGSDFAKFPDLVQFQLNDTHPSVAVAELMRLLMDVHKLNWEESWEITKKTCAYTNHTIMSEALEKWPIELFSRLLPRIYMIVEEINRRFCSLLITRFGEDPIKLRKMAIIADGQIRMAHLAIVGSHSVNGVAALHTEILKTQELKEFYEIYPERFNNKTNGITQRRWLAHCNPNLTKLLISKIGEGFICDLTKIEKLLPFAKDPLFQNEFMEVKHNNKLLLADHIKKTTGIVVDPNSIFDIQVKRLHEYKRQLMNILGVLDMYNQLKINPNLDVAPRTFMFAAKAAANYTRAKLIIKLINSVGDLINNDTTINGKLKVVFLENYCVSLAEKLIPAADVSEQISTASKEASGTGNMKFMLNGAVTIGTLDGANVEMLQEVGEKNIFIFGLKAEEVIRLNKERSYDPWDIYNMNQRVRVVLTQLINGTLSSDSETFRELYEALLNGYNGSIADEYYVLKDFDSYIKEQAKVDELYKNKSKWAEVAITNVAKSSLFSSDRTIKQYADEIWNLKPVSIK